MLFKCQTLFSTPCALLGLIPARIIFAHANTPAGDLLSQSIQESKGSELNAAERGQIAEYQPSPEEIVRAGEALAGNAAGITPTEEDKIVTAKILGAMPTARLPLDIGKNIPHKLWLLTESYLLQGKSTDKIHEGSLAAVLGGSRSNVQALGLGVEAARNELTDPTMPPIAKPANKEDKPEVMKQYRHALVDRHLREQLARKGERYSQGSMQNLYETLGQIVDKTSTGYEAFSDLFKHIQNRLSDSSIADASWLTNLSEADRQVILDAIADSNLPVHEETYKERYLHGRGGQPNYVAQDATLEHEAYLRATGQ